MNDIQNASKLAGLETLFSRRNIMQSTVTVAASAAVLPFAGSGTLAHQKAGNSDTGADVANELWHRYRENQLALRAKMAECNACCARGEPAPYDPDPIVDAHCEEKDRIADAITALESSSPEKVAALVLIGLTYTNSPILEDRPIDANQYEDGFALEALAALRPMLTGQIAVDVGELLDNQERAWAEFAWL